ncbi:hypothetical protein DVDV_0844 [Desulfovibrio sp. DV]|nr:hypothetical protein DVDV_0844 [Desulfovibrio sp. DV]
MLDFTSGSKLFLSFNNMASSITLDNASNSASSFLRITQYAHNDQNIFQ